jgi:hypothetical protein
MASLPISQFLIQRLKEYDGKFELRKGTPFEQLNFKPLEFIVQPLRDEANIIQTGQSLRRIQALAAPDAFDEETVDGLVSNVFVYRTTGEKSGGVGRAYFDVPVDREYPTGGATFVGSNSRNYSNTAPFSITMTQMGSQLDNGLYYFDISVQAEVAGKDGNLDIGGLVTLLSDPDCVGVTNTTVMRGGLNRETNTQLIERAKNSIGVRDLVVGKGFTATIFDNFASLVSELQAVGLGDDEMMRDIIYNAHIGGKVDGYFYGRGVSQSSKSFVGVLVDTTRQAYSSANVELPGTVAVNLRQGNLDRTNAKVPTVEQVKVSTKAEYLSPVNLTVPLNLSANQRIKMTIDGVTKEFRVAGVNPATTNRNEIVALINAAFGIEVIFLEGAGARVRSPTSGKASEIVLANPDVMVSGSALTPVFGISSLSSPAVYSGDGPIVFLEGVHYSLDDVNGTIARIIGANVVGSIASPKTTGHAVAASTHFQDPTLAQFSLVSQNDLLTVTAGPNAGVYRVLQVVNPNELVLDLPMPALSTSVSYRIERSGIKDGEMVYVQYYFNPLSIDIGGLTVLDELGRTRGVRPGRDSLTITDTAFLRISSIEVIDPVTLTPTGTSLRQGGFGLGGFGEGPFGIGSGSDFYMVVNEPTARFSAFEDSYIVIDSGFQGFSFRVNYDYAPEVTALHTFVRSERERVLDGDILMKHFLPAYVSGEIRYSVDTTDTSIPDNDALTLLVRDFISTRPAGSELHYSTVSQFILKQIDPTARYTGFVEPFTLEARVHLQDGSILGVGGDKSLSVVKESPFPKFTDTPVTARIVHWIADAGVDQVVLTRV